HTASTRCGTGICCLPVGESAARASESARSSAHLLASSFPPKKQHARMDIRLALTPIRMDGRLSGADDPTMPHDPFRESLRFETGILVADGVPIGRGSSPGFDLIVEVRKQVDA